MQELQGIKRKLVDALSEMGTGNRAMNDPAIERACHIAKALSDIATFEVMEESGNSGNRGGTSYGQSYGMSYGNDWQHGGNYREQTSRDGASQGGSYNVSYDGRSYADRESERRELEMRLEQLKREDMRR